MNHLRHLAAAGIGLGAAAVAACGATPTVSVVPAAATITPAATQPGPPAAAAVVATVRCDEGGWTGAVSPEGRPDGLDAGDAGALYVWHDGGGWHVRATDRRPTDHHYTGTIAVSRGATFLDVRPVRDESDDRVVIGGDGVLRYDLHTYSSIDGLDFRVSCPPESPGERERERLGFHTMFDGQPLSDRVRIGDGRRSPRSATFGFVRTS